MMIFAIYCRMFKKNYHSINNMLGGTKFKGQIFRDTQNKIVYTLGRAGSLDPERIYLNWSNPDRKNFREYAIL